MTAVEKFYNDAEKNSEMRSNLEELYKGLETRSVLDNKTLVKFANDAGYDFSLDELESFQNEKQEEFCKRVAKTPGNPWTCWERWVTFNFACGWDSGFPWKCKYKDECKKHC